MPYGPLPVGFTELEQDAAKEAEPLLAEARERLEGLEVETRAFGGGSPAGVITDLAESEDVDAIVVGSPHRGAVGRALIGSVAEGVLHGAPCAAIVAPRGYAEQGHGPFATIAVAYDGTPEAKAALQRAGRWPKRAAPRVRVLTVVAPPVALPGAVGYTPVNPPEPEKVISEGVEADRRRDRGRRPPARRLAGAGAGRCLRGRRRPAGRRLARLRPADPRAARLGLDPSDQPARPVPCWWCRDHEPRVAT